ncbi:MAG TPA: arginine repressor [Candidatus Alectryocaccobium stercorigallinarum]|jgi:transcriptional regulator of arginine metabolism|nr:arginine repressor [Candidatus Alectryocaccobium stercorigallinarum]
MKIARHEEILKLINEYDIDTQEELVRRLNENGFPATQATVSRDIRALNLSKTVSESGGVRYSVAGRSPVAEGRYIRAFKDAVASMEAAGNLIVIKTEAGMAMAAAAALDELDMDEIAGCIAGDNTVFAAVKTAKDTEAVLEKLKKIVG